MKNIVSENVIFTAFEDFHADKGFGALYLDGRYYVFYAVSAPFKSEIRAFSSEDAFQWRLESSFFVRGFVESVTAYTQTGKLYVLYTVKNILGKTDVHLALSKDGENYTVLPRAIIKNSPLKDIKAVYSGGYRMLIGSEVVGKSNYVPLYFSVNGIDYEYSPLEAKHTLEYLGSPSVFVAFNETYCVSTMQDTSIFKATVNLEEGTVELKEEVSTSTATLMRSVMVGEGNPMLFASFGSSVVPLDVYSKEGALGLRVQRELLKKATLLSDHGVLEGGKMPTEWARREGSFHLFTLPLAELSLSIAGNDVKIDENGRVTLNDVYEAFPNGNSVEINVLDMGTVLVLEIDGSVYTLNGTADNLKLTMKEYDDFSLESYVL